MITVSLHQCIDAATAFCWREQRDDFPGIDAAWLTADRTDQARRFRPGAA